ncbi:translesion error-prone DNA polymerase V autoproteolytic subunit [uncultured Flavobacterium sp.]|uniref:LexA family protein n=1 Tax=uncultured Flavobacterium sp. TaxID=165435 RepID=UPI00259A3EC7|nr:translesion error-prone DNA polymerase V autoproteolytic subunit [uncultured Flavobacterium sp.]
MMEVRKKGNIEFFRIADLDRTLLPFVGDIVAGFPSPAEDYMDKVISLDSQLINDKNATIIGKINGLSMVDANLDDGDLVVIDRSMKPKDGDIVICRLNSEFTCKQIQILDEPRRVLLVPANKKFKSIEIESEDDFIIEGVVTYVIKKVSATKKWNL